MSLMLAPQTGDVLWNIQSLIARQPVSRVVLCLGGGVGGWVGGCLHRGANLCSRTHPRGVAPWGVSKESVARCAC
jgi:hypothetical protein